MSKVGEDSLKKLLLRAERNCLSNNEITLKFSSASFPDYSKTNNKKEIDEIHAYLENAQRHQAITIDWQRNQAGNQIDRVCLGTIEKLASYLGVQTLTERIEQANLQLSSILPDAPAWLSSLYGEVIQNKWEQAKKAFGLAPEDCQTLHDVFKLISYLEKNGSQDLDKRSLSTRIFQDSKYIEKSLENKLVQIYKYHLNSSDLLADEILADLGIFKHPLPLLVKGNVTFVVNSQNFEVNGFTPYLGIPPDAIEHVAIHKNATYCLTIENLSSFNTYTRTINDGGIILYSNGFPGSKWQTAYKKIIETLPKNIAIFHWGDIDVGGFRILQKLQEYVIEVNPSLRVLPHLMESEDIILKNKTFTSTERNSLNKIYQSFPCLNQMLGKIPKYKQEQEALIPSSPLRKKKIKDLFK